MPTGLSGHIGFQRVSVGTLIWHDGTRQGSTDRLTVPYWCTIDVRTPWARHGVPTGPPGPRRDPTAAWRPAGGTVRLIFIGAPGVGGPQLLLAQPRLLVIEASKAKLQRQQDCKAIQRHAETAPSAPKSSIPTPAQSNHLQGISKKDMRQYK